MRDEREGNIDSEIMSQLGLTQQDIENFDPERIRKFRLEKRIRQQGQSEYERVNHHDYLSPGTVSQIVLFDRNALEAEGNDIAPLQTLQETYSFRIQPHRTSPNYPPAIDVFPDELVIHVQENLLHQLHKKEDGVEGLDVWIVPDEFKNRADVQIALANTRRITSAFLLGFGDGALEAGDIKTAINAYAAASENGILENAQVMNRLRDLSVADKSTGIEIARAIQDRINPRQSTSS